MLRGGGARGGDAARLRLPRLAARAQQHVGQLEQRKKAHGAEAAAAAAAAAAPLSAEAEAVVEELREDHARGELAKGRTIEGLKSLLRRLGLKLSGIKLELVRRLAEFMDAQAQRELDGEGGGGGGGDHG
jgi:hypothetical protein